MTERMLAVSPELALPIAILTDSTAIVGRKRVGKSNLAVVIVEEALDVGAQVVIFDPKGDWWGLRSSADGESAGYPIVVIGGQHAMLELNPLAGVAVADWIIDTGHSVVLDISDLEPAECERFCSDLLRQLRKRKKAKPGAILLVFDEADELAPQDTRFGSAFLKTLGLVIWMVKRGGFLGIGTIVVTQRPASLNKNVLTQTELFIALQLMGEQDIDAADGWFKHHVGKEQRAEILSNIGKLEKGEGYVLSGQVLKGVFRVRFRRRRTFDSGATPEMGELVREPRVVADVELEQLGKEMAAAVEEVKRTDPEILRKRIAELEQQLKVKAPAEAEVIQMPVLANGALGELRAISEQWRATALAMLEAEKVANDRVQSFRAISGDLAAAIEPVAFQLQRIAPDPAFSAAPSHSSHSPDDRGTSDVAAVRASSAERRIDDGRSDRVATATRPGSDSPDTPSSRPAVESQQKILDGIALLEHRGAEVTPLSIAKVIGLHENGGRYRGNLKDLAARGLILSDYHLSAAGRAVAMVRDEVTPGQRKILDVIAEMQLSSVEASPVSIAAWLDINANGGRFRGELKHLQITGMLDGYKLTRHARQAAGAYSGLAAVFPRLDPSTARLLELVRDNPKGLSVSAAAAKMNLHQNGGRFRSSIGRLFQMGVLRSKSELALTDSFLKERR
jgi:uncharacterized protein DUF87